MNFLIRQARMEDIPQLMDLAGQFSLLNLPKDKKIIGRKVEKSLASFSGETSREEGEYLFVLEDVENQWVMGSSQIVAKKGTPEIPNYSFQVLKKERFSKALGVGFIHQILRLKADTNGPTEIGGLVVSKGYRGRPEKVGQMISLSRFLYIGMFPQRFEEDLHSEMAPPLTEEGRSEFWEALGRRFTGMPYQEADVLSYQNKEFIRSLFPEEDIYLCLLDSKARLVLGRVAEETQPALHLLIKIGFEYKNEVDPFDGGPHLAAKRKDVTIIKNSEFLKVKGDSAPHFERQALVGAVVNGEYRGGTTAYFREGSDLILPPKTIEVLQLGEGDQVYLSAL